MTLNTSQQTTFEMRGNYPPLFSKEEIQQRRDNGEIQTLEIKSAKRGKDRILSFFEILLENRKCIVLLLGGKKENGFYHEPLLMHKEFFVRVLAKLRWSVNYDKKANRIQVRVRLKDSKAYLNQYLCKYLGLPKGSNIYTLGHPFDIRKKNLTTTNWKNSFDKGTISIYEERQKFVVRDRFEKNNQKKIAGCSSEVHAQQFHNAMLLHHKMHNLDYNCFGRVPKDGEIMPMFPDKYFPYETFAEYDFPFLQNHYEEDKLKPKYLKVFKKHAHLVSPIRDKKVQTEMKAKNTPLNFTCLDR